MNNIERTVAFECPFCHGGQKLEKIYIPVDFEGDAITCPLCDNLVEITPEWKAQLDLFKKASGGK